MINEPPSDQPLPPSQQPILNHKIRDQSSSSADHCSEEEKEQNSLDNTLNSLQQPIGLNQEGRNNNPIVNREKEEAYLSKEIFPPPEPLLPKTIAPNEPIRTGAPTPFLTLFIQEFKQSDSNPVVYNRYSSQFGIQSSAYQNSAYQILKSEFNPMTLLVNVKELITSEQLKATSNSASISSSIVLPYYTPMDINDKTLVFESRFESGNLAMAFKLNENEYNLVLSNDINTKGHTQWFFFRVTNTFKGMSVKFNILNHTKPDSLFNFGMKVLVYSEYLSKANGIGWHRDGRDIAYFQNNFKKDTVGRSRYFYTLTFTYDFQNDEDSVFFAYSYPYTYTDLTEELTRLERDSVKGELINRNVLCRTIAGNKCEYLTITNKNHPDVILINVKQFLQQKQDRKGVFLSSRIHPGESNSSWMMKGAIDFLVSPAPEAKILREKFVFKIVPMLNPDGVINGNYRCSLAGADLNRRWKTPQKLLFPEVFESKKLCKQFQRERQIVLYCDLHGHSRNKNIFIYGNNYQENPESTRLFPYIMSKICENFSFDSSKFSIHKSKEATARVAMWKELKIPAVYTMEASFCGASIGSASGLHFTTEHLMEAGRKLCLALLIYCDIDVPKSIKELESSKNQKKKKKSKTNVNQSQQVDSQQQIQQEIAQELLIYTRKALIAELMGDKALLSSGTKDQNSDGGGSESDPSEDNMEEEEMAKIIPIKANNSKKKQEAKKPFPVRKQFKQEEAKEQKQQQTQAKKSPAKKFNSGGSFFDRVRLPKSFGMRRVEMVDAWTQTSNRGSDSETNKDEEIKEAGTQVQPHPKIDPVNESNIDVSPTRVKQQINDYSQNCSSTEKSLFNMDSIRGYDTNSSQSVIVSNPNKNRVLVSNSQKRQSLSPQKTEFSAIKDRMQAMQIINQYIKETQMGAQPNPPLNNDPYNYFIQPQIQSQFNSPEKSNKNPTLQQINSNNIFHSEKKTALNMKQANNLDTSVVSSTHKRQGSNVPQTYYFDVAQGNSAVLQQQLNLQRGTSDNTSQLQHYQAVNQQPQQRTLEFKDLMQNNITSGANMQSNRIAYATQPSQFQTNPAAQSNNTNNNPRSLSGNNYIRSAKKPKAGLNSSSNNIDDYKSQGNSYNINAAGKNIGANSTAFNAQYLMQTGQGNSRATTLPQLHNDSMQKGQAIKQNKSQSFYEGIKPSGSFKMTPGGLNKKGEIKGSNNNNNLSAIVDEQFFNTSFAKGGNISPLPFENMPHNNYSFKIKPTMIMTKQGISQNNQPTNQGADIIGGSKRIYQSQQPIEDFSPHSTQNRDQITHQIQSKWPTKNRVHHNLNSGATQSSSNNLGSLLQQNQVTGIKKGVNLGGSLEESFSKQQNNSNNIKKRKPSEAGNSSSNNKSIIQNTNQLFIGNTGVVLQAQSNANSNSIQKTSKQMAAAPYRKPKM